MNQKRLCLALLLGLHIITHSNIRTSSGDVQEKMTSIQEEVYFPIEVHEEIAQRMPPGKEYIIRSLSKRMYKFPSSLKARKNRVRKKAEADALYAVMTNKINFRKDFDLHKILSENLVNVYEKEYAKFLCVYGDWDTLYSWITQNPSGAKILPNCLLLNTQLVLIENKLLPIISLKRKNEEIPLVGQYSFDNIDDFQKDMNSLSRLLPDRSLQKIVLTSQQNLLTHQITQNDFLKIILSDNYKWIFVFDDLKKDFITYENGTLVSLMLFGDPDIMDLGDMDLPDINVDNIQALLKHNDLYANIPTIRYDETDFEKRITTHWSPLAQACLFNVYNRNIDMIKLLLKYGADPNTIIANHELFFTAWKKSFSGILHQICKEDPVPVDIIKLLISYGANYERVDSQGKLPFYYIKNKEIKDDLQIFVETISSSKKTGRPSTLPPDLFGSAMQDYLVKQLTLAAKIMLPSMLLTLLGYALYKWRAKK